MALRYFNAFEADLSGALGEASTAEGGIFRQRDEIMPGVRVGDGAMIGSRAVLTKDVAPYERA